MTNDCIIGPLTFSGGFYLEESNDYGVDGVEKFTIVADAWQCWMLRGLITRGKSETSGDITIRGSNSKDWGPVWIDASTGVLTGKGLPHRGYYLIRDVDVEYINITRAKATLTIELITNNQNAYLEMDFVNSAVATTDYDFEYDWTTQRVLFEETFDSLNTTTIWEDYGAWNMTGGSTTVSGGKLAMSGNRTTIISGAPSWGSRAIMTKAQFQAPFTAEFDLEVPATSTVPYHDGHNLHFVISPNHFNQASEWNDAMLCINDSGNSTHDYRITRPPVDPITRTNTSATVQNWKVTLDADGFMVAYIHNGSSYVKIWEGACGLSNMNALRVGFVYHSHEATSRTVNVANLKIYDTNPPSKIPVSKVPDTGYVSGTPTGSRGSCKLFNTLDDVLLQSDPTNMGKLYLNSPEVWNNNNPTSTSRQTYGVEERLAVGGCIIQNGRISLTPTSTGVVLKGWTGTQYDTINTFTLGETITHLQLLAQTPEYLKLQINRTLWTIRRNEPFVYVKHPYNDLGFSTKTMYYRDGALQNGLAGGVDVPMLTQPYCLISPVYNILTTNQYGLETDLTGWGASGSTIQRVTPGYGGTGYAIEFTTNNASAGEGIMQTPYTPLPSGSRVGLILNVNAALKSSVAGKTVVFQIHERDGAGVSLASTSSSTITLTTSLVGYSFWYTLTNDLTEQVSMKVLTPTTQSATITGDIFQIAPKPNATTTSPWTMAPYASNRFGMMVIKNKPTTIKSNSLPASELTGIGVYDQMEPPSNLNSFSNLAMEWLNPVDQRLRIVHGV